MAAKKCDADHRVEEKEEEEEKTPKKPAEIPHRYSNTSTLISPNQHFALLKLWHSQLRAKSRALQHLQLLLPCSFSSSNRHQWNLICFSFPFFLSLCLFPKYEYIHLIIKWQNSQPPYKGSEKSRMKDSHQEKKRPRKAYAHTRTCLLYNTKTA